MNLVLSSKQEIPASDKITSKAMTVEVPEGRINEVEGDGFKVEGDLGDVQIVEESTDTESGEDDENDTSLDLDKQVVSEVNTLSNLPRDLVQATNQQAIGSVTVANSENVHFGNNTYFNGPVTIKQLAQPECGIDNVGYTKGNEDLDIPTKGGYKTELHDLTFQKYVVQNWLKLSMWGVGILLLVSTLVAVLTYTTNSQSGHDRYQAFNEGYENGNVSMLGYPHNNTSIIVGVVMIQLILILIYRILLISTKQLSVNEHERSRTSFTACGDGGNAMAGGELVVAPGHLRMVSRTDWLAQPVDKPLDPLRLPAPWVIVTHTATPSCFTQSKCVLRVRLIQTFHIESRDWYDIGYNFLVGGDGSAYVGRGWDYMGAHTKGYNKYSISIAFIGTFNTESPTKLQVQACMKLMELGVAEGKLAKDYKLFAHRQLMSTLSPGDQVFDIIKTWPHFVNTTEETDFTKLLPDY